MFVHTVNHERARLCVCLFMWETKYSYLRVSVRLPVDVVDLSLLYVRMWGVCIYLCVYIDPYIYVCVSMPSCNLSLLPRVWVDFPSMASTENCAPPVCVLLRFF